MSSTYTGNDASFPTSITIADDLEDEDAASVGVGLEGLADQTAFLKTTSRERRDPFLVSGTWTCPDTVTCVRLYGYGNGASGGGGGNGNSVVPGGGIGGAGGAGSQARYVEQDVTPGVQYDITIPAAAAGVGANTHGNDGGDVTFAIHAGATLQTFRGAQKGQMGQIGLYASGFQAGGAPVRGTPLYIGLQATTTAPQPSTAGQGGFAGEPPRTSSDGNPSSGGYVGGTAGATGADVSGVHGGTGGGGGGAGPGGNGGAGGAGGAGSNAAGTAGTAAAANTGAGGGGGGGGGSTTGVGAGSGAAGTGKLIVMYVGRQAVVT